MTKEDIFQHIKDKQSYLCIGLDTDLAKIPPHLLKEKDPIFEFNKQIIDATKDVCVAYKPNTAFYESLGAKGWRSLEKTVEYIGDNHFKIADAKRGDIGNTSRMYAKAFFEHMNFDAITVAPYMGVDSVMPFLEFKDKWVILLALTSNKGAEDFQFIHDMFKIVIQTAHNWGTPNNLMFVIGATQARRMAEIRKIAPDNFFLVPGIGEQGGNLNTISQFGMNNIGGLLVNSSRDIIYAGNGKDFAEKAYQKALHVQQQMAEILKINK